MFGWITRVITREQNWSFHKWVVPAWKRGDYQRAIMIFLNRLPQYTVWWGKGGDEQYDIEWADAGKRGVKQCGDFFGPSWRIAWWRETLHFSGGLLLGVLGIPIALLSGVPAFGYLATAFTFAFFFYSEMEDGAAHGWFNWKEVFDMTFWVLGSLVAPTITFFAMGG